jgi:hypothetical protein
MLEPEKKKIYCGIRGRGSEKPVNPVTVKKINLTIGNQQVTNGKMPSRNLRDYTRKVPNLQEGPNKLKNPQKLKKSKAKKSKKNVKTMEKQKIGKRKVEWLAGKIDGDGCFLISKAGYASMEITMGMRMKGQRKNRRKGQRKNPENPRKGPKRVKSRVKE